MKTTISNVITVHDPTPEVKQWAEKELVLPNPEYAKKERMGYWVGNTPRKLTLYEQNGFDLILPFGVLREIWPMVRDSEVKTEFTDHRYIAYSENPLPLYDYQEEALEAMVLARFGILQSPAGSGKTQIGIALIQQWNAPALWLCHTADLLRQSRERGERYMDKSLIGTITEGRINIGRGVTFATVQTMCNIDLDRYRHQWGVIIVDEAHRVSGSPTQMTRYYKVLNALAARHKYGLTATPDRSDGLIRATKALLGEVVYQVPDEAVAEKIMKVAVKAVPTETGLTDECLNEDGTLNYTGLINHLTEDDQRTDLIAKTIERERDHSCLILSDRILHLQRIIEALPEKMREKAVMIDGTMVSKKAKAEREAALEQMRTGEKKYLFATYSLAKEGLDIPRLDRLYLTTPIKYHAVVIQSIGRIARTFPGKEMPIAYDFVDVRIRYCGRAWKERCRHYRKAGAMII